MDLLGRLFGSDLRADVPNSSPLSDWWYTTPGLMTESGVRVGVDTAKKISAWYRGRDILATVLAMLPLPVMERLPNDGGAQPAKTHPLYDILHDKPNVWQDSFQWRRQQMYHLIDFGNGVNRIVPGARGFVHELHPVHPSLVNARQLDTGRIVYDIRNPKTNAVTTSTQDEIFHLRGASDDGVWGKGILEYARSSLGTASATESYAANIFSRGTLNGGVIENPGLLNEEAARRMANSFMVTKMGDWHLPKILEQGSTFKPNEMTPEDAQMLLSRKYTVDDIARWLGVPRLMLENSDPSFGNAEQFTQNFIDYAMGQWLALWEFAISDQLILAPQKYFARFTRQALVRGNFKDRIEGLVLAAGGPIMTPDEARVIEDLNTLGGKNTELRENQNVTGKPTAPSSQPDPQPAPKAPPSSARAELIATESAARVLRKEIAAVQKMAVRHAANGDTFAAAVTAFYAEHVLLVEATLLLSHVEAESYCSQQAAQVLTGDWIAALETWQTPAYASGLAAIALEEQAA